MDWDTSDKNVTYKKTMENGLQGHSKNEEITAVGFYSEESYMVLTHNELKMQIHFVNYDHTFAACMDEISLKRLKLYLPEKLEEK